MRSLIVLLSCAVAWLAASGCSIPVESCTAIYIPAVRVTVVDSPSGAAVCDATVTLAGGGRPPETLVPLDTSFDADGGATACLYNGGDGDIVYTVTVSRDGFAPKSVQAGPAPADHCGTTKSVDVRVELTKS